MTTSSNKKLAAYWKKNPVAKRHYDAAHEFSKNFPDYLPYGLDPDVSFSVKGTNTVFTLPLDLVEAINAKIREVTK